MKISVVIPTHDRPDTLRRALDSVRAQTVSPYEVLVVDDGTKHAAEDTCSTFKDSLPITCIPTTGNTGGSAARNRGIEAATGDVIAFLDDDDVWMPEKLEQQGMLLASVGDDVGFSTTSVFETLHGVERATAALDGVHDIKTLALSRFKMSLTSALMVRKRVLQEVGGFDESLPSHQDAELFIRMSQKYKMVGINTPLTRMSSDGGRTHIGKSLQKKVEGRVKLLEKHHALYEQFPVIYARERFRLALLFREAGDTEKMRQELRTSLKYAFSFRTLYHLLS